MLWMPPQAPTQEHEEEEEEEQEEEGGGGDGDTGTGAGDGRSEDGMSEGEGSQQDSVLLVSQGAQGEGAYEDLEEVLDWMRAEGTAMEQDEGAAD